MEELIFASRPLWFQYFAIISWSIGLLLFVSVIIASRNSNIKEVHRVKRKHNHECKGCKHDCLHSCDTVAQTPFQHTNIKGG